MSCQRCGGFMMVETVGDFPEQESGLLPYTERCVNCGNFEDSIIRANRSPRVRGRSIGTGASHNTVMSVHGFDRRFLA
jgi:hypothetical protein